MPKRRRLALLKHVVAHRPEMPVIMITAHGTVDTAVEALKLGAFDYVTKPFDRDEFLFTSSRRPPARASCGSPT
jgi:two-component system response regulator AtoC